MVPYRHAYPWHGTSRKAQSLTFCLLCKLPHTTLGLSHTVILRLGIQCILLFGRSDLQHMVHGVPRAHHTHDLMHAACLLLASLLEGLAVWSSPFIICVHDNSSHALPTSGWDDIALQSSTCAAWLHAPSLA